MPKRRERGRLRSAREPGGRTRGDAGQGNPPEGDVVPAERGEAQPPTPEPMPAELMARADLLRRTAETLYRRMEDLAAQIDAAAVRERR